MNEQVQTTDTQNQRCCGANHGGMGKQCHQHRFGRCFGKMLFVLAVFGMGFLGGKVAHSCEHGGPVGGPPPFMGGMAPNSAQMGRFADMRVQHLLAEVKASDAQKAKVSEIVKAALDKGAPLLEKGRQNHEQLHKLLAAATLDKAAIEALRVEQIKLADEGSKLMTQTMLSVAEVLTPEQRAKLAEKMEKMQSAHRGGMGHHH